MINCPQCVIIAGLISLVAFGGGGYAFGYDVAKKTYTAEILALQNNANSLLAEKTREVLAETQKRVKSAQQIEVINREHEQKINAALSANRSARLLYKAAASRCPAVSKDHPTSGSPGKPESIDYELPRAITDDLFQLAARADRVANYADSCYRWVQTLQ